MTGAAVCVGVHAHEEPERLRATLAALRAHTGPHELLLLGDGPDPPTRAALLAEGGRLSIDDVARGGAACFNRLARESDAGVLVLLESGSLVSPDWLEHLLAALAEPGCGLAGPSTNRSWNEQSCSGPGAGTQTLEPLLSLADFCYAVRREVVDAIGLADEGYGLGPCWEMDYNVRAARAGFRGLWARAAWVERMPFTARREREERARFDASRRRYQDAVCGLRLRGARGAYEPGCRGEACEHFAPAGLVRLVRREPARSGEPARPRGEPLVSCVMPTRGRRELALRAVRYWQQQDYPERELVVVDDGDDGLERALPADPRIVYLRAPAGESIGAKRNRACEVARGELVAQWDDDDWYGPRRLSAQAAPILAEDADVTGLRCDVVLDLPRWRFWTCPPALHERLFVGDVHGGTLVFRRSLWQAGARYPDRSIAEDAWLLWAAIRRGARLTRLAGAGLHVYVRHDANAWQLDVGSAGWEPIAEPALPPDDRAFYAARSEQAGAAPLVTCLMPTCDRRRYVARAIDWFLRQDYPARELLVLDDGADRVADLVPADPRVRYVALDERLPIGSKRNRGCDLAAGALIAHWDDDDWHAPHRLSYQVAQLERTGAEACGAGRLLYAEPASGRAWLYEFPQATCAWIAGNTLLYRRSLWERNPFADVAVGEDTRFVWSGNPRLAVLDDHRVVVGLVHDGNTSRKQTAGSYWSPRPLAEVQTLLGADAEAFLHASAVGPRL
jgi:glycosyltransferase involved in cell wall biosynthesis